MTSEHPIEGLMLTAMNSIQDMVDVNTIIGEPIETSNNIVIIPISKVSFGFAAGGSEFNEETIDEYIKKEKEDYTDIPQGDWNPFVVVELPKAKYKEEMNISEEYAFVLKYCTEEKYHDKIELIKQREKGIFYRMEYANNISQNEKEWLKKLEEERYEMMCSKSRKCQTGR